MTEKLSLIPIKDLSSHLKVRLLAPYSSELYAPVHTWQKAWQILKLDDAEISIRFVRDVPRVYIILNNPDQVIIGEEEISSVTEKRRKPTVNYQGVTGSLFVNIPYTDEEARTPQEFAKSASVRLASVLPRLPDVIYQGSGLKALENHIHLTALSLNLKFLLPFETVRLLLLEQSPFSHALTDYLILYLGFSIIKFVVLNHLYQKALQQDKPNEADIILKKVAKWPFPVYGLTDALVPATLYYLYSFVHRPLITTEEQYPKHK